MAPLPSIPTGSIVMSSEADFSVSRWIVGAKAGESAAVRALWQRYFQQLVCLARQKLAGTSRRAADEEDVALSAFASFCRAAEEGRFPDLAARDDLWRLLMRLTARKAVDQARREGAAKRGGGQSTGNRCWPRAIRRGMRMGWPK